MATLTLVYEDEQEIELRLSDVSFRTYYELATEWDAISGGQTEPTAIMAYYAKFADALLVRWSYPEDATGEHFQDRPLSLLLAVVRDWFAAMREVAAPLPVRSSVTGLSPERSTEKPANRAARRSSTRSPKSSTRS